MCMLMGEARVASTDIFATMYEGRQVLVYGAKVESLQQNAMVLPIPVRHGSGKIELLDLSAHPGFFDDLREYYFGPRLIAGFAPMGGGGALEVFTVGSYDASIVPLLDDFGRLDTRFRLAPGLQSVLTERYDDWSFIVYQFSAGKNELHPFGVIFDSRYNDHLFFPTVHVHDGAHAPPTAEFAHEFFAFGAELEQRRRPYNTYIKPPPPPSPPVTAPHYSYSRVPGAPPFPPPIPPTPQLKPVAKPAMPYFVNLERDIDIGKRFGTFSNVDTFARIRM